MKEYKVEETFTVETVKTKIWSIFDILRSENITSENYHVVLFLLSAYKDGLISPDVLSENDNIKDRLFGYLHDTKNELANQYMPILRIFEPIVMRLSERGLTNMIRAIANIEKKVLTENFPDVFDSVLYRISQSQGRYAGEFIQPVELTRFMCGLG
jgi:type I restriction enzyme M protein